MPFVHLPPGAGVTTCPACGSPMSAPRRGRQTQKWLRECTNLPACTVTTVTDETPADVIEAQSRGGAWSFALPQSLPFPGDQP